VYGCVKMRQWAYWAPRHVFEVEPEVGNDHRRVVTLLLMVMKMCCF
jgi:hypothetical protein